MRARTAVAAIVVVSLLPGAAAAEPGTQPAAACDGVPDDAREAVLLVDNVEGAYSESVALYPGTRVYVVFCDGGEPAETLDGSVWNVAESAGLVNQSVGERTVSGLVPDDRDSVELYGDAIQNKETDNRLTIDVQRAPSVDSELAGTDLTFRSETAAATYGERERAYLNASQSVASAADDLNDTADRISTAEGLAERRDNATATIREMQQHYDATLENGNELDRMLAERTQSEDLPPGDHAAARDALRDDVTATNATVAASLDRFDGALAAVESAARGTVLRNLLGGLVAGLLVGAVAGALVVKRTGESAAYFRDYGSGDYDARELYLLGGLGAGLVVVGVALLVVTGVAGAIA